MGMASADPEFEQRARLALVWQDLVTPVRAIVGYQEIIVEEARRLELGPLTDDLAKVLAAAANLMELVDSLRDPSFDLHGDVSEVASLQSRLRHDLRTPLNAIIGYTEMAEEDIADLPEAARLVPDFERLLEAARGLLGSIDTIVDFGRGAPLGNGDGDADASAAMLADLLRTLRPENPEARPGEVGRILAVDDNASNRDLLCRRLTLDGHDAVAVASGREALEVLAREPFDLVLLDLLMPEMNGIEVLTRLKADQRLRDIPVIMISGLSESDAVIRCIESGAEDYLPKPFNIVLLRARINAALERNRWRAREREYLASLQIEKDKSDALLRNIFPDQVVARLNGGETVIADRFEHVAILFADVVGFTTVAVAMPAARLVDRLNRIFTAFDRLAATHGIEKIKTIGDAYMAASGLPEPRDDFAPAIVDFAIGMLEEVARLNADDPDVPFNIRIGIHCGPVIAGIIGQRKYIYDVWGDTVNVASRLESHGLPKRIQISDALREAIGDRYSFEPRGKIALKGRGEIEAFLLEGG